MRGVFWNGKHAALSSHWGAEHGNTPDYALTRDIGKPEGRQAMGQATLALPRISHLLLQTRA